MRASRESGGSGLLQCSQVGLSSSMIPLVRDLSCGVALPCKEAVHDRVVPEFCDCWRDALRQLRARPAPGMNAGAEGDGRDLRRRIELGEERQRSLAALERDRVVVDA